MNKETKQALELQNEFNHLSPMDIDNLMEWLRDNGFLSKKGTEFSESFWAEFIKSKVANLIKNKEIMKKRKTIIETKNTKKGWTVFVDGNETKIGCEKCIYYTEDEECKKEDEMVKEYGLFCGNVCGAFKIV